MTTHAGAAQFLARFFGTPRTAAPVFVTSLPNVRGEKRFPPRRVTTRDPDDVERFADKWDQPERALYFCVATVKQGCERSKATLEELTCLHTDLDYKSIAATPTEIETALAQLALPPSRVNFTGHGLHAFWLFAKGIPATPEHIDRIELHCVA